VPAIGEYSSATARCRRGWSGPCRAMAIAVPGTLLSLPNEICSGRRVPASLQSGPMCSATRPGPFLDFRATMSTSFLLGELETTRSALPNCLRSSAIGQRYLLGVAGRAPWHTPCDPVGGASFRQENGAAAGPRGTGQDRIGGYPRTSASVMSHWDRWRAWASFRLDRGVGGETPEYRWGRGNRGCRTGLRAPDDGGRPRSTARTDPPPFGTR